MASQDKHVAYYRVSTDRQGKSGLGLEAQRAAVVAYLNGGDWQIVGNFTETESGKRSDRPELDKALAAARLHRCPLVVSKVDRLTRSVAFLSRLLEAGVDVRFADLPQNEGATGRFLLQQMVAVAELEADLDLVGVDVEPQLRSRNLLAGIVDTLQLREVPVRSPQTGIRLSRSWRGFLLLAAALKEVVEHRKDLAAVADLAHRQRRSIGAQALIQRPKR
jgi:hypothetical protein